MRVLYDITRLIDRADALHPTGVDRVDLRYAMWTLSQATEWKALRQRPQGFEDVTEEGRVLIERLLRRWIEGKPEATSLSAFPHREREKNLFVLEKLSHISLAARWQERAGLGGKLAALAPTFCYNLLAPTKRYTPAPLLEMKNFSYWNIGHNYKFPDCYAYLQHSKVKKIFFLHDVIPLTHPETQKVSSARWFSRFVEEMKLCADVVIASTRATLSQAELPRRVEKVVSPLPVEDRFLKTFPAKEKQNHYVCLGTIEPRKNISFLLEVWEVLRGKTSSLPTLYLVGKRGWDNADLFFRIDQAVQEGWLKEVNDASDEAIISLLLETQALLFPSAAEGWGIPVAEALALGTPVLCGDLPVLREVSQGNATICPLTKSQAWVDKILTKDFVSPTGYTALSWQEYFDKISNEVTD